MTHKISALNGHYLGPIGPESDASHRAWLVLGVGYTDDDNVARYATHKGYCVEKVDVIPASYVTALDAHLRDDRTHEENRVTND